MCPYARFQSAMFDKDTLIISYDEKRGEPRGSRKRGADPDTIGLGHCIDCTLCVQVCPTGIDIREGLQYECIACAACIDACDSVMDKMNYPRGLVRYSTEHAMKEGQTRILRPRVLVYAVLLLVLVGGLITSMATRTPIILDVIRDRNFLFRELPGGEIENIYTLKIVNQRDDARTFRLAVSGVPGIELEGVAETVAVDGGAVLSVPVSARAPAGNAYGIMDISFSVTDVDDPSVSMIEDSRFLGPTP
jgi:cytochrome c oxidase accessory protein FixG